MTKSDKALVILLRFVGVSALFALVAVFIPSSRMAATHRWLGLGEMPTAPVVEYLARSVSAFYALMGALCLVLTTDLERYRPLVRFLGVAFALMSLVLLNVGDQSAGSDGRLCRRRLCPFAGPSHDRRSRTGGSARRSEGSRTPPIAARRRSADGVKSARSGGGVKCLRRRAC
jgi:hypothetical protein